MALGLTSSRGNVFAWLGDKVKTYVSDRIQARLYETGRQVVATAQQLAPVDTGRLRASIGFVIVGNTLQIYVDAPYGIYQEFGTRNIPPHPFIRPALNAIGRIWGADVEMTFNRTGGPQWHGLLAGKRGFAASASPAWKPLTPRQVKHVETVLVPGLRRHNTGNVRRASMKVRAF